jgi:hypothetical protein
MTIKQQGGIFGRNPTFNIATASEFVGPVSGLATSAEALKSSATTGLMQIAGPAAGQTRTMSIPDANFTAARTDAAQSFTGNQTLTDGNLIVSNGKGIDFSATPGTGTSELFNDYEEGTWTPVSHGASTTTYSFQSGVYVKVGSLVFIQARLVINNIGDGSAFRISGLPFSAAQEATINISKLTSCDSNFYFIGLRTVGTSIWAHIQDALDNAIAINANFLKNATEIQFSGTYRAT